VYVVSGQSWLLKIGGILLFATAIINPVLLSGISQSQSGTIEIAYEEHLIPMFSGRFDRGNRRYNGGSFRDNPTAIAALASLSNLTPPVAPVCDSDSCHVEARTAAIVAECKSYVQDNPDRIGTSFSNRITRSFCSRLNSALCVSLDRGSPAAYANFTSGDLSDSDPELAPGDWSIIFGAWVSGVESSSGPYEISMVDCGLTIGNLTVRQRGSNPPSIVQGSYQKANWSVSTDTQNPSLFQLNRIYREFGRTNSPFSFDARSVGTGGNSLYLFPVGFMLLGDDATDPADVVARRIEASFDMATLSAFAKLPNATDLTTTIESRTPIYVYNPKVLAVLLVPLIATILAAWGRWRIGDDSVVVGYDPIEIARRGPVSGLPSEMISGEPETRKQLDCYRVWGYSENVIRPNGREVTRQRLTTDANGSYYQPLASTLAQDGTQK
jgi:hypothetical protein